MLACQDMDEMLVTSLKFFKEGVHEDGSPIYYRKEITQFLSELHDSVDVEFGKELKKVVLLAAKGFNKALEDRRNLYIKAAGSAKMANERIGKLQPQDAKLFGGKAGELSKAMRNESELLGKGSDSRDRFHQYKPNYFGNRGGGGFKPRGAGGRGHGSFSRKKDG